MRRRLSGGIDLHRTWHMCGQCVLSRKPSLPCRCGSPSGLPTCAPFLRQVRSGGAAGGGRRLLGAAALGARSTEVAGASVGTQQPNRKGLFIRSSACRARVRPSVRLSLVASGRGGTASVVPARFSYGCGRPPPVRSRIIGCPNPPTRAKAVDNSASDAAAAAAPFPSVPVATLASPPPPLLC
jgi:hypothetical protein